MELNSISPIIEIDINYAFCEGYELLGIPELFRILLNVTSPNPDITRGWILSVSELESK